MSDLGNTNPWWAVTIILIVPIIIIGAAELDERLRQRESPLRPAVRIIRNWALPFFAVWALLVPVLNVDRDSFAVRVAATGLLLSVAVAVAVVIRVLVNGLRDRPETSGRRAVPQLVLALPRLILILVTGWILIDSVWGVDLSAALTALGVTSLVVSFALQDTLSGLASGMLLLSDQPFKPGDWISAGDNEGVVVDINWRTSRIRTRNGDMVIVPNSELAGASIVNYSSPDPLHRVTVQLTVAYANPPTLAKEMLLDAARNTPGVLEDPPPFVAVWQIDDPLMGYEVQMWVDDYAIGPRVKTDFGTLVWYQSFRHDVPLPSPAQDLYLWDGVKNAEDSVPTMAEVRSKLSAAHLLSSLADDDVDRLTHASRLARFSVGEVLLDSSAPPTHLIILVEGRAMLHVDDRAGTTSPVAEINEGEILGLLHSTTATGYDVFARAEDDCVVLMIDSDVAGEVASRNPELSDALNRTASIRRRRTERALENRTVISASAHDVTTEVEAEGDSNGGDQP